MTRLLVDPPSDVAAILAGAQRVVADYAAVVRGLPAQFAGEPRNRVLRYAGSPETFRGRSRGLS